MIDCYMAELSNCRGPKIGSFCNTVKRKVSQIEKHFDTSKTTPLSFACVCCYRAGIAGIVYQPSTICYINDKHIVNVTINITRYRRIKLLRTIGLFSFKKMIFFYQKQIKLQLVYKSDKTGTAENT